MGDSVIIDIIVNVQFDSRTQVEMEVKINKNVNLFAALQDLA